MTRTKYSFPNISFNESVVGPIPFEPYWRNTIGVAAVFSRGPVGPTRVRSRQDFVYIFGEDTSPGALFVRQAMLQGATDFFISRVIPSAKPSEGVFSIQSDSPLINEPFVADSTSRTIGLSSKFSFVSDPIYPIGSYVGDRVRINGNDELAAPNYIGYGFLDYSVVEKVVPADVTASSNITTDLTNVTGVHVISATGSSGTTLRSKAKPGLVIRKAPSEAGAVAFSSGSGQDYLRIESYAFELSPGTFSVVVSGAVTGATGSTVVQVQAASPSDSPFFVIGYNFRQGVGDDTLFPTQAPSRIYSALGNRMFTGFSRVNSNSSGFVATRLLLQDPDTLAYSFSDVKVDIAFGPNSGSTNIELVAGARFSVNVMRTIVRVGETDTGAANFPDTSRAFERGMSASEVLSNLRNAMNRDSVLSFFIDDYELNDLILPFTLTFRSSFMGTPASRIKYRFERIVSEGNPNDLLFGMNGSAYDTWWNMVGGSDPMINAARVFYDINGTPLVLVQALSPGRTNIEVTIRPLPPGRFRLEVKDLDAAKYNFPAQPEVFILNNNTIDRQTGFFGETSDSKLVSAFFIPALNAQGQALPEAIYKQVPQRLAPAVDSVTDLQSPMHPSSRGVAVLTNVPLVGGTEPEAYNPDAPDEEDFVEAIRRLEGVDVSILSANGFHILDSRYELAISELISQAERSSTVNGLRTAVLAAPPNLSSGRAEVVSTGISSKNTVIIGGWNSIQGTRSIDLNSISPAGIYCGLMAAIPPHVSPAAVAGGAAAAGVRSVDTRNDPEFLEAVTQARIDILYFDPGLRVYKFLNGRTSSIDPQERYISVRRALDQIIMDLYRYLQWVRSSPHTRSLRSRVASATDGYLLRLLREERIFGYRPTICDESNNTVEDVARGRMNLKVTVTPVFPSDFIEIDLVRDLSSELTLSTSG
jgi:hypothetical protein